MAAKLGAFAISLQEFAKQAPENARTVVRKVAVDALSSVVLKTPVGNPKLWKSKPPAGYVGGRMRANWNVGVGRPNVATSPKIDKTGGRTIQRGTTSIAASDGEAPVYLTNSLPYALEIEYGYSSQAPAGMVRITVLELQQFVDAAVKGLPK